MRRPVLVLTLLAALAAPLAPVPAAAAAAPAVRWAPCAEDPAVDCGTMTVPIDWNDPRAGTSELDLARRRASAPSTPGTRSATSTPCAPPSATTG
ncbi:hypothetical protein [Nonomuraea sp. NPDC052265]|uniref:hypothetical protein n=1 Tax=Nonomuraea sp. NPDC052265 TaxID=3364374 RepID=UPI0037C9C987